jgi:putative thiazole-containing bacteriocin maturation protein
MRPKLRGDTFYLPTTDGIYFRNNKQELTLKGQDLYQWFEALEPYLNGEYTLGSITEDLEPGQQAILRDIVEALLAHGFLKDLSHDQPHTLDERELATYAAEIAFIDSFRDSAAATFERFRAQRVLIIGSGLTALALVHATLQAGIGNITVWITDECETYTPRLLAYREQSQQRDPRQALFEQRAPDWQSEEVLREALLPFDVVLHCSDRLMVQRALTLNKLCFTLQKPLFQALIFDDQALIGPLVTSGLQGCWECAWRRWLSALDSDEQNGSRDPWCNDLTTPVSPLLGLPTAATVANILSFECFKYLTGAGSCEISGKVLQFALETLRCQSHTFLPHPLCRVCQHPSPLTETAFLERIHALEEQEALAEEIFSQIALACFDPSLGIFPFVVEDDLVQMPLNVSRLTVSAPMDPELPQKILAVTSAGLGFEATRRALTLQGCALYAARLVDQRRLTSNTSEREAWAYDLRARQAHLLPATQAYPIADLAPTSPFPPGVSAGLSWAEACARGLLDHCLAFTFQEFLEGKVCRTELSLDESMFDAQGKYLHTLVKQSGQLLHISTVNGTLQVPTLAFCIGNETVVYTAHFDMTQALNEGLACIVQHLQARQEEQPEYALPATPYLSPALRGVPGLPSAGSAFAGWQEGLDWLVEVFHRQHWRVLALPLDHDPALTAILPFLVRILLVREGAQT